VTHTVIHLVRHGEVDNPAGVLYGRLPGFALSELGRKMAPEFGITPTTDDRLIESSNFFEGKTFGVGDGSLRNPSVWRHLWNPFRPSWGEPYAEVAARMLAAIADARDAAAGHEAVLVSHQLPIEVVRRSLEGQHLWHRPDRRRCALASITAVRYDGDRLLGIDYLEPAGESGRRRVGGA
jgi:broad specificity phosphatase PhoE